MLCSDELCWPGPSAPVSATSAAEQLADVVPYGQGSGADQLTTEPDGVRIPVVMAGRCACGELGVQRLGHPEGTHHHRTPLRGVTRWYWRARQRRVLGTGACDHLVDRSGELEPWRPLAQAVLRAQFRPVRWQLGRRDLDHRGRRLLGAIEREQCLGLGAFGRA